MLQCKNCYTQIFINNSENDHCDTVIVCSQCGVKNVLEPTLIDKVQLAYRSVDTIDRLCEALKCEPGDILIRTNEAKRKPKR